MERSTENEDNISGHEFTEIYDRSFPLSLSFFPPLSPLEALSSEMNLRRVAPVLVTLTPVKPIRWIRGTVEDLVEKKEEEGEKNFYAPHRRDSTASTIPPTTCRVTWPGRIFSLPLFSSLTPSRGLTPSAANSFVESVHRDSSRRGIFVFVG